jgi:hypothetical protein
MWRFALPLQSTAISQMVGGLAMAVASAQDQLNRHVLEVTRALGDDAADGEPGLTLPDGRRMNLLELGFMPAFFKFTEARITIKLSVSSCHEQEQATSVNKSRQGLGLFNGGLRASSVHAAYASRYQYRTESASMVSARLVALPGAPLLEQRLQQQAADTFSRRARREVGG